jgi:MYXO-CTERM domain-containing protein
VRVIVSAPPDEEDPDDTAIVDTGGPDPGPGSDRPDEGGPGALVGFDTLGGCGCASARGGGATLLGLAGLLSIVRRRRRV